MTEPTEVLYNKDDELREKIGKCLNIFPDEFKEYLPNAIGTSHIDELEKLMQSYGDQRELEGRIAENDYYWHRQRAIRQAAKDGTVSLMFLDRKATLTTKKEKE